MEWDRTQVSCSLFCLNSFSFLQSLLSVIFYVVAAICRRLCMAAASLLLRPSFSIAVDALPDLSPTTLANVKHTLTFQCLERCLKPNAIQISHEFLIFTDVQGDLSCFYFQDPTCSTLKSHCEESAVPLQMESLVAKFHEVLWIKVNFRFIN